MLNILQRSKSVQRLQVLQSQSHDNLLWKGKTKPALWQISDSSWRLQRDYFSINCSNHLSHKTHYEVLNINISASGVEIREAFLKLSKQFHPDINKNNAGNHEKIVSINEAYTVLSKPVSRRDYDVSLRIMQNSNFQARNSSYYSPSPDTYYHHAYRDWDYKTTNSQKPDEPEGWKKVYRIVINYYTLSTVISLCFFVFVLTRKEIIVHGVAKTCLPQKDVNEKDYIMTSVHEGKPFYYYAVRDENNPELYKILTLAKKQSANGDDTDEYEVQVEQQTSKV